MAYAVDHTDKDAVGDGVRALDGPPGVMLGCAELGLLIRMPADGRGIKKNVRSLQRGQARAFGIPLVPADQSPHAAVFAVTGLESHLPATAAHIRLIALV